jgi:hypothetical protein
MSEPTWFDDDPDPTGVRILLAAEPEPGPMPEQVADRIRAALAEAGRRADLDDESGSAELSAELGLWDSASGGASNGSGLRLIGGAEREPGDSEHTEKARSGARSGPARWGAGQGRSGADVRRRWTILGGVAASVAALGLGGALLSQGGSSNSAATAQSKSVSGAAQPEAAGNAPAGALGTGAAAQSVTSVHIERSTRAYTKANVVRLAQDMLDTPGPSLDGGMQSSALGPISTITGLTECITTLGEGDATSVSADLALFENTPAAIVVIINGGLKQVYAVEFTCTKGSPDLIYGPLAMP